MIYWLLIIALILVVIAVISILKNGFSKKKKLEEIKAQWGLPKDAYWKFNLIEKYLTAFGGEYAASSADLDLDDVFCYIDRTSSKPGQQYLFKKLHDHDELKKGFDRIETLVDLFDRDTALREQVQIKLSALEGDDAYYLPELFSEKQQTLFTSFVEFYIRIAAMLMVGLVIVLIFAPNPACWLLFMICILSNFVIHYSNKTKMLRYTHSLPQVLLLNKTGNWLNDNNLLEKSDAVNNSLTNVGKLKKSLGFINAQSKVADDPTNLTYIITEWIKIFFLLEPLSFVVSISKVNQYPGDIKVLFDSVAEVDIAISVLSLRSGLPYYCKPEYIADAGDMVVEDLYHPLVENCVQNSITINSDHGVLITGSNMSGKTTFIRTLAINTLLAQTLNTSFAKAYKAPPLQILTSINMTDDLSGQKSYFQAEALSIRNIIRNTEGNSLKSLVIIDEIFRGTNTIERIAAAKAVLSYFIMNNCYIIVSTHDLELASLLGSDVNVYSFEEVSGENRLTFDYKIKQGLLKNKNGIAVLKGLDYPQSIIDEAAKISAQLRDKYDL